MKFSTINDVVGVPNSNMRRQRQRFLWRQRWRRRRRLQKHDFGVLKMSFDPLFSNKLGRFICEHQTQHTFWKNKSLTKLRIESFSGNGWKEARNGWGHLMVETLHAPTRNPIQTANLHQMEIWRDSWQQLVWPWICLNKYVSKKNRNVFQVARLWTHHFIQIQLIKTPSDICIYEEKMPVLSENKLDMYMLILFMCQSSMFSRNDEIIHWECVCVEIPPTGNPCTKLLEQTADDASSKEKLMLKINAT